MSAESPEVGLGRRSFVCKSLAGALGLAAAVSVPKPLKAFLEPTTVLNSSFLMYHAMNYSAFKKDLLGLIGSGQQPISPSTAVNVINGLQAIPDVDTFMVSCDDALFSQRDSILRATEEVENETGIFVPVVFCAIMKLGNPPGSIAELPGDTPMYNDKVHKYMSLSDVIGLIQAGHIMANHTVNHARLPELTEGARNAEVEVAEQRIDDIYKLAGVERTIRIFTYPEGRYQGQLDYIGAQGFDLALSTDLSRIHTKNTIFRAGRVKMS